MSILSCTNLSKSYFSGTSTIPVLDHFSYELQQGEIGMLMGPSGCGKTTLLMIAGGILTPDKGSCKVCDQNIYTWPSLAEKVAFRARHISFVFQHLHLFPALSAIENVALPLLIDGVHPDLAYQQAKKMMLKLGLEILIHSKLDHLSGGQKQRIAIGRAMLRAPSLILCDEPTSNLDKDSAQLVFSVIQEYANNHACTFLICTHDQRIAHHADTIVEFKGLNDYQITHQRLDNTACKKTHAVLSN